MRSILVGLGALMLSGCATTLIPVEKAVNAPADEVFAFQAKAPDATARITVLRDSGMVGSGCDIGVYVDGTKAANLGAGEKASFWVRPGVRNVSIGSSNSGICAGLALRTLSAELQPSEEKVFRISLDMQGVYINPYVKY